MDGTLRSNPSFAAPELDVESVAVAVALVSAEIGEPEAAALEGGVIPAFRHEEDAVLGELVALDDLFDFCKIRFLGDDKFEPGLGGLGKK